MPTDTLAEAETPRAMLVRLMRLVEPYVFPFPPSRAEIEFGGALAASAWLQLKPPEPWLKTTEAAARLALFEVAQTVIEAVERDGWTHLDHPDVRITGVVVGDDQRLRAEGWLTLRLAAPVRMSA